MRGNITMDMDDIQKMILMIVNYHKDCSVLIGNSIPKQDIDDQIKQFLDAHPDKSVDFDITYSEDGYEGMIRVSKNTKKLILWEIE